MEGHGGEASTEPLFRRRQWCRLSGLLRRWGRMPAFKPHHKTGAACVLFVFGSLIGAQRRHGHFIEPATLRQGGVVVVIVARGGVRLGVHVHGRFVGVAAAVRVHAGGGGRSGGGGSDGGGGGGGGAFFKGKSRRGADELAAQVPCKKGEGGLQERRCQRKAHTRKAALGKQGRTLAGSPRWHLLRHARRRVLHRRLTVTFVVAVV